MKAMFLAFVCSTFLFSGNVMASPQVQEGQSDEQCSTAAQSSQQDLETAIGGTEADAWTSRQPNAYWHCTAYPNGHGHGHGHDGYGYYYNQAYWQAMRACQYYHGYCHAHCHVDHH